MTMEDSRPAWAIRLQAEREARGWNKPTMAAELHNAVGIQGRKTKSLVRQILGWERGDHYPRNWTDAYAAAFGIEVAELFPAQPGTLEETRTVTPLDPAEDDVKRRQLIQDAGALAAGATIAPVLASLSNAWHTSQPRLPGSSVSQTMLDDWAAGYDVHIRSYALDAPEIVLAGLARDWAEMAPHLATKQPEKVQRDLAHAAAKLAYLIAGSALQLGDYRQSSRWWLTARAQADKSGDSSLSSWVRSWEVTNRVVETREDLTDLLMLAQDARQRAGSRPSTTLIYATTVEAEVLAFMGHHDDAVATIRRAENAFTHIPAGQPHREELLQFDQSCVYSLAGLRKEATEAQQAASTYYSPEKHLYTSVQLDLHGAVLHARTDPNEASRQALNIVDSLPPDRRIKRVILAAQRVLDVIPEQARALPAARELRALRPVA